MAYIIAFFSTPISSIGFILFVISSLACDAVLVSNDYIPILTLLTTVKGIQIYCPVQKLLDADDQNFRISRPVHCVCCRHR
jgi:hypothetical protein